MGELEVQLIESRASLPLTATAWNALVVRNETNTLFQTYEWFDAWWQSLGRDRRLFFLVVRCGADIVGFAPLMLRRTIAGLRQIEFIGTGNADYQDFVFPQFKQAALLAVLTFLRGKAGRWDRLRLTNVPQHSSTLALLTQAAGACALTVVEEATVRCPALLIEGRAQLVRQLIDRYSVRRPLNWFNAHGVLRSRHVTNHNEIRALLPAFFAQHEARWRAAGGSSLFESPAQRNFYVSLADALRPTGWLSFYVVEFNGRPIAFHFGFDYFGCILWYKPSFDPEFASRSPGLLLTRQLIEDALMRSKKELDFTIGDEAFKSRFANYERFNGYASVYSSLAAGRIASGIKALRQAGGRLKRRLRARD